jgi:hypothetical protein
VNKFAALLFVIPPLLASGGAQCGPVEDVVIPSGSALRLPAPPASDVTTVEIAMGEGLLQPARSSLGTSVGQEVAARVQSDGAN